MKILTKGWILAVLGAGCLLAAGFVFRPFWMRNVIMPIALLLWAVLRLFMSINQEVYWVALIFAAFVLGLGLLPVRESAEVDSRGVSADQPARRFHYWHKIIRQSAKSREGRAVLENNLRDLAVNLIALEERKHPNALREDILHRRLELPKDIRDFLSQGATGPGSTLQKEGYAGWLSRIEKRRMKKAAAEKLEVEMLLEFLENFAEISDDNEPYQQN